MRNIFFILGRDIARLARVPQSWVVLVFLFVLPSLYTWVNVVGFWDPYGNVGNLRVCVVNEDVGAQSELMGDVALGEELMAQLAEDDQLGWTFSTRDEALAEVASGQAFAAFVIPESFSEGIAGLAEGRLNRPQLEYYVNEKLGPMAPKIADSGADTLTATINAAFVSTASAVIAEELAERLTEGSAAAETAAHRVSEALEAANGSLSDARSSVEGLSRRADEGRVAAEGAGEAAARAQERIAEAARGADDVEDALDSVGSQAADLLVSADGLVGESAAFASAALADAKQVDEAIASSAEGAHTVLKATAAGLRLTVQESDRVADAIKRACELLPEGEEKDALLAQEAQLRDEMARAQASAERVEEVVSRRLDSLESLPESDSLAAIEATVDGLGSARRDLADAVSPLLADLPLRASGAAGQVRSIAASQTALAAEAQRAAQQLADTLANLSESLAATGFSLEGMQGELASVRSEVDDFSSSALARIASLKNLDKEELASFMAAPTQVHSTVFFPVNAYGIGMAPLFMNLTLWVGAMMLIVLIRLEVDPEGAKNPTIAQLYLARWLLLALIAIVQALVCCTGCMVIGVQCANVPLLYLTAVVTALAYLSIQYALSTTLHHVGRGLVIVLALTQIPAATGMYPVEMTTEFFQAIYPVLPFTHGINALRETINGFYGTLWLERTGTLVAFAAAFLVAGLLVRPLIVNVNHLFSRRILSNGLYVAEPMLLPERPLRLAHGLLGLALEQGESGGKARPNRIQQFLRLYARLKPLTLGLGLAAGFAVGVVLTALQVDKTAVLAVMVVWETLILVAAVLIEYTYGSVEQVRRAEALAMREGGEAR